MRNRQIAQVIAVLNSSWTNKPLDTIASTMWGQELARHDFDNVMKVIRKLLREQQWRPSLAQIIAPFAAGQANDSAAAFENVWAQISKRPPVVNAHEQTAVDRLGGWDVLRNWQIADRHWHAQRFVSAYKSVIEHEGRESLRAMVAAPERRQLGEGAQ